MGYRVCQEKRDRSQYTSYRWSPGRCGARSGEHDGLFPGRRFLAGVAAIEADARPRIGRARRPLSTTTAWTALPRTRARCRASQGISWPVSAYRDLRALLTGFDSHIDFYIDMKTVRPGIAGRGGRCGLPHGDVASCLAHRHGVAPAPARPPPRREHPSELDARSASRHAHRYLGGRGRPAGGGRTRSQRERGEQRAVGTRPWPSASTCARSVSTRPMRR